MRIEQIGAATLYCADCRDILPTLGKVDAVVTSPPYLQQRDYGLKIIDGRLLISTALKRLQHHAETQILVNLGLVHRDGQVIRYWDELIHDMMEYEWRLFGWYVWDQLHGMTGDWNGRLAPAFEFIFHFNKNPVVLNKTKLTKGGRIHSGNIRKADGSSKPKSHDGKPVQPFKIPDSIIRVHRETEGGTPEAEHPARFPVPFAIELIEPFTSKGSTVLDPFMGVATTGVACAKLGRKFIGIEIDPGYFDIACRRIEKAYAQPDLFIAPPTKSIQEVLL